MPNEDELLVADVYTRGAAGVRDLTLDPCNHPGFLGPTLLLVQSDGIRLVADRPLDPLP